MNINDGETHKILFTMGKLFLDGVQIAGEGFNPPKDIMFEFKVHNDQKPKEEPKPQLDSSVLEIKVHENMAMTDVGPGQGKVSGY